MSAGGRRGNPPPAAAGGRVRGHLPAQVAPPDALRRVLADQAFSRAAGAPLVDGNRVDLLQDAAANYPAWLASIEGAQRSVHLETYIFREDPVGRRFADALAARARAGVRVRILYDWLGALGKTGSGFWRGLRDAGCEVRGVNPPRFDRPLAFVTRDHRKLLCVDGRVAYVSGLCIGRDWEGDRARGIEPWRDTGVCLEGPVVADCERAFAEVWATAGPPLPGEELPSREELPAAGQVPVRLIASGPESASLFRLDLLVASLARDYLWLADAYFAGNPAYLDALRTAAAAGVDVRLLVPGASDVPLLATFSRTMYRPLLEGGVRVFEWNGPMMHAKTAVADGRWGRVGSTNLNAASWFGNWELDVAVESPDFARRLEQVYREDLERSVEVVLGARHRVRLCAPPPRSARPRGSANRATAAALRLGGAVGTALSRSKELGPAETSSLASIGGVLLLLAALGLVFPRLVALPLSLVLLLLSLALLLRAARMGRP